jgi:hypothetical protein
MSLIAQLKKQISNRDTHKRIYPWPRGLERGSEARRLLGYGSEYRWGHGCLFLVNGVCCKVEVSVSDCSLVQKSPNDCGLSTGCDLGAPAGEAMTRNRVEAQQQQNSYNIASQGEKSHLLIWHVSPRIGVSIFSTATVI